MAISPVQLLRQLSLPLCLSMAAIAITLDPQLQWFAVYLRQPSFTELAINLGLLWGLFALHRHHYGSGEIWLVLAGQWLLLSLCQWLTTAPLAGGSGLNVLLYGLAAWGALLAMEQDHLHGHLLFYVLLAKVLWQNFIGEPVPAANSPYALAQLQILCITMLLFWLRNFFSVLAAMRTKPRRRQSH